MKQLFNIINTEKSVLVNREESNEDLFNSIAISNVNLINLLQFDAVVALSCYQQYGNQYVHDVLWMWTEMLRAVEMS